MALAGNCQRHLRISFFLIMWMCSYIQMVDQLRMDLCDLSYKQPIKTIIKSDGHEKNHETVNPFFGIPGEV
jgi:hypothetical protein